jgi:hypothetical protein
MLLLLSLVDRYRYTLFLAIVFRKRWITPPSILFLALVIGFLILLYFARNDADWGFFSSFFYKPFFLHEKDKGGSQGGGGLRCWMLCSSISMLCVGATGIFASGKKCFSSTHALISSVHQTFFVSICSHFLLLHFCSFHGSTYHIHMESANQTEQKKIIPTETRDQSFYLIYFIKHFIICRPVAMHGYYASIM